MEIKHGYDLYPDNLLRETVGYSKETLEDAASSDISAYLHWLLVFSHILCNKLVIIIYSVLPEMSESRRV